MQMKQSRYNTERARRAVKKLCIIPPEREKRREKSEECVLGRRGTVGNCLEVFALWLRVHFMGQP